jgi:hypothetical protein
MKEQKYFFIWGRELLKKQGRYLYKDDGTAQLVK